TRGLDHDRLRHRRLLRGEVALFSCGHPTRPDFGADCGERLPRSYGRLPGPTAQIHAGTADCAHLTRNVSPRSVLCGSPPQVAENGGGERGDASDTRRWLVLKVGVGG